MVQLSQVTKSKGADLFVPSKRSSAWILLALIYSGIKSPTLFFSQAELMRNRYKRPGVGRYQKTGRPAEVCFKVLNISLNPTSSVFVFSLRGEFEDIKCSVTF